MVCRVMGLSRRAKRMEIVFKEEHLEARGALSKLHFAEVRGRCEPAAVGLLDAVGDSLGVAWVGYLCDDLRAVVVADQAGCYDPTQNVIIVDSNLPRSEQIQQLLMEMSNHQNRLLFEELNKSAHTMTRAAFIQKVEEVEFIGVQNVIRAYDQAHAQGKAWARDPNACVYGAVRKLNFEEYFAHLSAEHRERIGRRHDELLAQRAHM
jgi:hypothetical protein